ncbi:MAG: LytR C-terminal domain-containing protein [Patescibacteria group bacterium]
MPTKKKTERAKKDRRASESEAARMTVVTEVVEVAGESPPPKGETAGAAPMKDKLPTEEASEAAPGAPETEAVEPPEKRKEVVEELFKGEETGVTPEIAVYKGSSKRTIFVWAATVIALALVIGGGLILAARGGLRRVTIFAPKPTPTPTLIPTPTPEPVKRENLTIEVLNGGGIAGAASKMKKFLEEKGYKVEAVGNTEAYTYGETEILVKPEKAVYLSLLEEDLKDEYTIGTATATLTAEAAYDAQIIVGKK